MIQKAYSSKEEKVTMVGYARSVEEFYNIIKHFAHEYCKTYEYVDNIDLINNDGIYLLTNNSSIKLIKRSTDIIPGYLYNSTTVNDCILYEWNIILIDSESLQTNIRNSKK